MKSRIYQAIKQDRAYDTQEEEVFVNLQFTADMLAREFQAMLKPFNLSSAQFNALRILRGAGADGLPCREVGERMIKRDPDVTRLLDRLEKAKLVARERETSDRRVVTARISAQGLELLTQLDAEICLFHKRLLGRTGKKNLGALAEMLDSIRANINNR